MEKILLTEHFVDGPELNPLLTVDVVLYPGDHLPLHLHQVVDVQEHLVHHRDGRLQLEEVCVPALDGFQLLLGGRCLLRASW